MPIQTYGSFSLLLFPYMHAIEIFLNKFYFIQKVDFNAQINKVIHY